MNESPLKACECLSKLLQECTDGVRVACHRHGLFAITHDDHATLHCLGPNHATVRGRLPFKPSKRLAD